jgi:uncharacterized protein YdhG (YjbR/CyaY superfamily)
MAKSEQSGFTAAEKAAMKARAQELKKEARAKDKKAAGEKDALEKIAEMPKADRDIAQRVHAIVKEHAPDLAAKTMYGMPAYANEAGTVVCFFQAAAKWDTRYATLNFDHPAKLDDGDMWPTSFAIVRLTPAVEERIVELVKRAVGS